MKSTRENASQSKINLFKTKRDADIYLVTSTQTQRRKCKDRDAYADSET